MLAREATITVVDFESTGHIAGLPNEPWQIGMVRITDGKVDSEHSFESLLRVDPTRPFNPNSPGRHQKIRHEIAEAPKLQELWDELETWWIGQPLTAHNVSVEKSFIEPCAPLHHFGPWIDTLEITRFAYPELESHSLEDLVRHFAFEERLTDLTPHREAHDALYDAVASALLLEHFLQLPGWEEITIETLAGTRATEYRKDVARKTRRRPRTQV